MIVEPFGGPGGWDEGARAIGLRGIVGIENDLAACQTRAAAGHATIRADVAAFPLDHFGDVAGLIASPPCTDWSQSGRRAGLDGETGALVLEVDRFVRALRPRWIACEQVPPALEWWNRYAYEFRDLGYSTWSGLLNAADFGVPQTRQRAFLIASLVHRVGPPHPTHARSPMPGLFGDDLLPWVSMAEALVWGLSSRPYPTIACSNSTGGPDKEKVGGSGARGQIYRKRDEGRWVVQTGNNSHVTSREGSRAGEGGVELYERSVDEPAPTLDRKVGGAWRVVGVNTGRDWKKGGTRADAQIVPTTQPAPVIDATGRWQLVLEQFGDRPATTVCADPRIGSPGHDDRANQERQFNDESIRLTIEDALILQSFRPDYPLCGNKTKQFEQVGNAVPPVLAAHVLRGAIG